MNNISSHRFTFFGGLIFCLLAVSGCDFIHVREEQQDVQEIVPIARVHNTYLSAKDIQDIVPTNILARDSLIWVQHYVGTWIKQQLLIAEALKYVDSHGVDIDKKVNDYRNSLVEYQFRKLYVQKHLVDSISEEEIQAYYHEHQSGFRLKKNIIKGTYIKVPRGAPGIAGLKKLIYADKDKHQLASYCLRFSTLYHLHDSTWVDFDNLILGSPIADIRDKVLFLRQHSYFKTEDANAFYFLKIDAYKLVGNISPLEFVRENIKVLIINQRKVALAQQQERDVYGRAVEGKDFERYDW